MDIMQIVGLGLVATILVIVLKTQRPEFAMIVSLIVGVVILMVVISKVTIVISLLTSITQKSNIDISYLAVLLKIIGIAYIVEFAAELCKDAGESAIASKIELAGKVTIVVLAIPIMMSLLDLIVNMLE